MPLVIGPNAFTQPDYTVTYVDGDRRRKVGRNFYGPASSPEGTPWVWTVEWHQREGRTPPGQGNAATEGEAKAAWKLCWESAGVW
jgi:hypothetical protein